MSRPEPTLRQELTEARANLQRQIDRLRARPYPYADVGAVGALMAGFGAPFRANLVMIDNSELISKLTEILRGIEEALAELGPDDA
jgi:hypothetical protein